MAPAFEMNFFDSFIRPSLYNAYVGWGEPWPVPPARALAVACCLGR